jgi:hypothetical protein
MKNAVMIKSLVVHVVKSGRCSSSSSPCLPACRVNILYNKMNMSDVDD